MAKNRETDSPKKRNQRVPKGKQKRIKQRRQPDSVEPKKVRLKMPEIRTARTEEEKALAKQYNYQRNRLKNIVKEAKKRGYIFDDFIPVRKLAPTKADVEKLKQIKGDIVYKHARYYDVISDKYIPGTTRRKQERSEAAKKAAATRARKQDLIDNGYTEPGKPPLEKDDVLQYLFEMIAQWQPETRWSESFARLKEHDKNVMASEIRSVINEIGENEVAKNVQKNAAEIKALAWHICYGNSGNKKDGSFNADLISLLALIKGRSLSVQEAKRLQERVDTYAYEDSEE